jgi:UDP-4-amino-4,6-dideoxy-N-acetyl-beta-L-altrosamine transaminase
MTTLHSICKSRLSQENNSNNFPEKLLPYGRQTITEADINAVEDVLRSDWLTQGPMVTRFEEALAQSVHARSAIVCSNGTAALHLAMLALRIGPRDVVVTSPNTFVADANCARYVGADIKFADIDPNTGNICPENIESLLKEDINKRIKAIIPVHFAGQPADLERIFALAKAHGAWVVDDACHALGATYETAGETVSVGSGQHSDMTVFSFHPVKHVATGEGGAICTNNPMLAGRLRMLRSHGIVRDHFIQDDLALSQSGETNAWYYEFQELGYNYRLTDIQAALGISQLKRLSDSVNRRNEIAALYCRLLKEKFPNGTVKPLTLMNGRRHAYHLFVVNIDFKSLGIDRHDVMTRLRELNVGTQVHYIPVHFHPYYRNLYGDQSSLLPNVERYYSRTLSLPMFPGLSNDDIYRVVNAFAEVIETEGEDL